MNQFITNTDIVLALRIKHRSDICCEELRLSSGFAWQGRIDFWAMSVSPASGNKCAAYEIKVSKSDFRRDTYEKQRGARLFSDQFYYIAPVNIIPRSEIPDWAGLIECEWRSVRDRKPELRLTPVITAPKRDKDAPSWGLVCSLIRNTRKHEGI